MDLTDALKHGLVHNLPVEELIALRASNKTIKAMVDRELKARYPGRTIKSIINGAKIIKVRLDISNGPDEYECHFMSRLSYWMLQGLQHFLNEIEDDAVSIRLVTDPDIELKYNPRIYSLYGIPVQDISISEYFPNITEVWCVIASYNDMSHDVILFSNIMTKQQIIEFIKGRILAIEDYGLPYGDVNVLNPVTLYRINSDLQLTRVQEIIS